MIIFGIYVDDCLTIGKEESVARLNDELNLKVE
jgi:hypothetical protein